MRHSIMDLFGTLKSFNRIRRDIERCYDPRFKSLDVDCRELEDQQEWIEAEAERVFRELVQDIIREEGKSDDTGPLQSL